MSYGVIRIQGTFGSTGQSASAVVYGGFNAAIWGTPLVGGLSGSFSGTIIIERSLDGGTTWIGASTDGTGTVASYTTAVSVYGVETEDGVMYRFDCTVWGSGTINYRLSQVGDISIPLVRHA